MPRSLPTALIVLALLAPACTLGAPEAGGGGGAINVGSVPLLAIADRTPAPDVSGETLDGRPLALADLEGRPTLVNFWASWCGPCAREIPELVEVAAAFDGQVHLLGVNVKDSHANARAFERDQGVTYPSLFDPAATIAAQFGGIAPEALPSTILLDAEHRVAVRLFGAVTAAQLRPYLDELLAEER